MANRIIDVIKYNREMFAIIASILFTIILIFLYYGCGNKKPQTITPVIPLPKPGTVYLTTPKGVKIIGKDNISIKMQQAIDDGIDLGLLKMRCQGWSTKYVTHKRFSVFIRESFMYKDRPMYKVKTDAYRGTPFGKNGFVYVSGEIAQEYNYIKKRYEPIKMIILPDAPNAEETRDVTSFELEHWALFKHWPAEFERTKVHKPGIIHPLLKTCKENMEVSSLSKAPALQPEELRVRIPFSLHLISVDN